VAVVSSGERWDDVPFHAVRVAYVAALVDTARVDVATLPVEQVASIELLDRFDGLLLTGGASMVHPSAYGAIARADDAYDRARDTFAFDALRAAHALGLPTFGVCRGLQEMAVAFGGSLRPLPDHREDLSLPRDEQYLPRHGVALAQGGLLQRLLHADEISVNSLHGQGVDDLGPVLRREAVSAGGAIEAASHPEHPFFLGVQWHPEWYAGSEPVARTLFEAFGAAVRGGAGAGSRPVAPHPVSAGAT